MAAKYGTPSTTIVPYIKTEVQDTHDEISSQLTPASGAPEEASELRTSELIPTYGGQFTKAIVQVLVGQNLTAFSVHRDLLANSAVLSDKMLHEQESDLPLTPLRLQGIEADTFGLFLTWLYSNGEFPWPEVVGSRLDTGSRVGAPIPITEEDPHGQARTRLPSSFFNALSIKVRPDLPDHDVFYHINIRSAYKSLSPEELRFIEGEDIQPDMALDYMRYLTCSNSAQFFVAPPDAPKVSFDLSEISKWLQRLHMPGSPDTETLSLTLVKVMIMAEGFGMCELFNHAMDHYRKLEHYLQCPPRSAHIRLAYSKCRRDSPLLACIADSAFDAAKTPKTKENLMQTALECQSFMEDLMKRNYEVVGVGAQKNDHYHLHVRRSTCFNSCPGCVRPEGA